MTETQRILMERDGLTEAEAKALMNECAEELMNGNNNAIMEILGLENDYIFDLI